MSHRSLALTAAVVVAVLLALLAPSSVAGQTQSAAPKAAATAPRTPDGKPDLQGIWTDNTVTPLERPKKLGSKEFYTEQEFAELMKRVRQGDVGEEGDLGAANPNPVRYDLELYGFDKTKVKFGSNKRTSLIVGPEGTIPPMLPEAKREFIANVIREYNDETGIEPELYAVTIGAGAEEILVNSH